MLTFHFHGHSISRLGMGGMRFPMKDDAIDYDATKEILDYAMANGINYYDTAYGYHSGQSEVIYGKILSGYPRESYYLADKFPGYDLSTFARKEEIFEEQLRRCQTEYFDFYLCHNVCEKNIEAFLDPKYGLVPYLLEQKKAGKIRHLGFSTHGSLKTIRRFLEAYGEVLEFCQIQLNWLDYSFQNADEKIRLLTGFGLPVWVMEPLRGGKLVNLSEEHKARLCALRPDESIPAWSFRYLQSLPNMGVILSGMSTLTQLKENIATFSENKPTTPDETAVLYGMAEEMKRSIALPCTVCRYCVEYCPQGLDIPRLLTLYNDNAVTEGGDVKAALSEIPAEKQPSACLSCRSCEEVCPQQIRISEAMERFASLMN